MNVRSVMRPPAVMLCLLAAALLAPPAGAAGDTAQQHFAAPRQAVRALVAALRADQPERVVAILGPGSRRLVFSGDAVADRLGREEFVAAYDAASRIDRQGAARAVLVIGKKQWPFPIPLVLEDHAWRFDTQAGAQEILDRRIGRNELSAIETCRAYVDAQRDYAATVPGPDGLLAYARRFLSSPGKHDGLYWPSAEGEPQSPMGPLVAEAREEGYVVGQGAGRKRTPYHGYYYRILDAQGPHAADGARSYIVDGAMIGGFALVAFPARYGDSGIMSFIVNQDGIVYQKNLGKHTTTTAREMGEFDPDPSWTRVAAGEAR